MMTVGEVISSLSLCASSFDDDKDRLLLLRSIYSIKVFEEYIEIYFVDSNTVNIRVYKDGRKEYLT